MQIHFILITDHKLLKVLRREVILKTVLETNKKSNSSLKADSVDSLHNSNNSHIYEDIEDLYIDDSFPGNLDNISKNPNFPEPFYYCLEAESEQCLCKGACAC